MRKNIFFAVPLMVAVLISACADSGNNNNNTPPPQSYNITGKIDYAGKTISSAKVCLDVNNNGLADDNACVDTINGEYTFTSSNNPAYYPLAAFITEDTSAAVNAKITVDNSDYDSILYAPRGKTETISIATTLAKSLMDKDSALSLTDAESTANRIITNNANNNPATVLTVYNNALNSANITNISTSIRGLVNVITDKLNKETNITDNTNITVSQEEVNTANDEISKADEEQPQEPQEPENPSGKPATPLEKVTEMLAGAEIKNAENPVNLNGYIDKVYNSCVNYDEEKQMCIEYGITEIGIKPDTFGGYTNFNTEMLMTRMQLLSFIIGYEEDGWPSDSELDFEVIPSDRTYNNEQVEGYLFTNHLSNKIERQSSPCNANGVVNGIYYKSIFDIELFNKMRREAQVCYEEKGGNEDPSGEISNSNMILLMNCLAEAAYNNKDNIKIEKWYWTIDTTKIEECSK